MWLKKHKWKILIPALVLAVLAAAFFLGDSDTRELSLSARGSAPGVRFGVPGDGPARGGDAGRGACSYA